MKQQEVKEVIACLGSERRVFHYFKDRFCFDLIELEMNRVGVESMKISELKSGRLSRYVRKPSISNAFGQYGGGVVFKKDLKLFGPRQRTPFLISLNSWGSGDRGWDQTSRNQCNLVLQLNFDRGHEALYKRLVKPLDSYGPFEYWSHPVCQENRKTLAWVRMDIDFKTDEVLIEEIQNDWLREASRVWGQVSYRRARKPSITPRDVYTDIDGSYEDLASYVNVALKRYREIWAEAAMLAAIRFINDELGISTIYYHSFETGRKLKAVCGAPPKSMYTKLPREFGFELVSDVPDMLSGHKFARRCIKAIQAPAWYRLAV